MAKKKSISTEEKQTSSQLQDDGQKMPPASDEPAEKVSLGEKSETSLSIVGIGASAGGLEAFEQFFVQTPPDTGMAFVLVQHLDPTHESLLVDLLQRCTRMKVLQVEDNMPVEANHIYVIPPNRDMALLNGTLHLMEPGMPRGLRLPIDFFFRSLAKDQQERAIGVVLSGTGTDGTLGLKAIKEEGGLAMVQDPATAKYDGMPRSAIATGLADYVLAPEKMPEQLVEFVKRAFVSSSTKGEPLVPPPRDVLQKIFVVLRDQTGHDFSQYKENTIGRRIQRRMNVNRLERVADYVRYLQQTPLEVDTLFKELLIGVTGFFRDRDAFASLEHYIPRLLIENRHAGHPFRVWVPGCSTGEEAYSIAILIREQMTRLNQEFEVQIFATDIDNKAIEKARLGFYPDSIAADVSPERLERFFSKDGNSYQVGKEVREMVVFAVQSLIKDPPFSRLDLISCRNLLIYLGSESQKKALLLFHYALNPDGLLFLGPSETLGELGNLFTPLNKKWKLYQRYNHGGSPPTAATRALELSSLHMERAPGGRPPQGSKRQFNLRDVAERMLLQGFTPPAVFVNETGDIQYIHGTVDQYLRLAAGEASLNILRMAREGLLIPLTSVLRQASSARREEVVQKSARVKLYDESHRVKLVAQPVLQPAGLQGLILIVFEEIQVPELHEPGDEGKPLTEDERQRIWELEHDLSSTKQYLQTTIEELETSNEELKSTNEELQSANEELQSTNEELETSKEELQSVNEELVTVNSELQAKIEELTRANDDVTNLLASTQIGTIFLNRDLCIQRFTPSVTKVVNLIETDLGRPLAHTVTNLVDVNLVKEATTILDTLNTRQREVESSDGRWYWMQMRPYRTKKNFIGGVVITFSEVTEQKKVQQELRKLTQAVEQTSALVMVTDTKEIIEYVNPAFSALTGYSADEAIGQSSALLRSDMHPPEYFNELKQSLKAGKNWHGEFCNKKKDGSLYWERASITPVRNDKGEITHFIKVADDVTERKQAEDKIHFQASLLDAVDQAVIATNLAGTVIFWNRFAEQLYGWPGQEAVGQNILDLINPRLTPEEKAEALAGFKRGEGSSSEFLLQKRDGTPVPVLANGAPIYDDQGRLIGQVGVSTDISKRKEMEAKLQRLAGIVESASDAIIGKTLEGIITSWNKGAEQLYGFSAEEVLGQPITMLFPPEQSDEMSDILTKIKQGESLSNYETTRLDRNGRYIDVALTISPVKDAAGQLTGASTIARDITARKLADRALQRAGRVIEVINRWHQLRSEAAKEAELLKLMCELLVDPGGYHSVWIGMRDPNGDGAILPTAWAGYEPDYNIEKLVEKQRELTWEQELAQGALAANRPAGVRFIHTVPSLSVWRHEAAERGYASALVLPFGQKETGQGLLQLYAVEPDAFDEREISLLTSLVDSLVSGLRALRPPTQDE